MTVDHCKSCVCIRFLQHGSGCSYIVCHIMDPCINYSTRGSPLLSISSAKHSTRFLQHGLGLLAHMVFATISSLATLGLLAYPRRLSHHSLHGLTRKQSYNNEEEVAVSLRETEGWAGFKPKVLKLRIARNLHNNVKKYKTNNSEKTAISLSFYTKRPSYLTVGNTT